MTTAVYAGSFDPPTLGHVDIITRSLDLCDKLIILVAPNSAKRPCFTADERADLVRQCLNPCETLDKVSVRVMPPNKLLVEEAKALGASLLIRGLRAVTDFEYEFQMAQANKRLAPEVETVFMMTSPEHLYVSSSIVKEIARCKGDISGFVSPNIAQSILERVF